MRLETVSTSRRSILKFASAMPTVLALGGMAACTPQANHGADQPHVADAEGEELWQAMELAAKTHSHQQQFPSALEAVVNQEITLTGFIRKTPSFNRILLTRRAVGCPACDAQKLWPVTELQLASAPDQIPRGPVEVCGEFDVRRFKGEMPFALKRAFILEA
ncbi:MAG: hypothetical protein HOJ21_05795 [Alphaproteobacteria bacterium]|jgi:hypothetical protein|nr:hypothetical protein [Alphaproteobacteria bacterium]